MKIKVLGGFGGEGVGQRATAFLVNDRVLIDAGTVSGSLGVPEQLAIEYALISHAHLDHVVGVAYLSETLACCGSQRPVTLAAIEPVVNALQTSLFNNVVWPDFSTLPPDAPVVQFRTLTEGVAQPVGDLGVTPVAVNHSVPASGFIVSDDTGALVYSGDTGPTDALWQAAHRRRDIRAIILECAFPNRLARIAEYSSHMTPDLIRRELEKLPADVPVWIFHVKPQFYDETAAELQRVGGGRVSIVEQGKTYTL